jgi:hypothetical protein
VDVLCRNVALDDYGILLSEVSGIPAGSIKLHSQSAQLHVCTADGNFRSVIWAREKQSRFISWILKIRSFKKIHEMNRAFEEESTVASIILNKSLESASRAFLTR